MKKGYATNGGSGGAKKLVVSVNAARVFDLEDLFKASVELQDLFQRRTKEKKARKRPNQIFPIHPQEAM